MKKLVIGCLGVLVICGIAAAAIGYYVYRQVQPAFSALAELKAVPDIEGTLEVRGYTPPESGELTEQQIERLLEVQKRLRARIGAKMSEFEARYKALAEKEKTSVGDLPELLNAYRDLAAGWLEAKRAQVEALNDLDMSLEEYKWIREQAYKAAGLAYVDLDVAAIVEDIRSGVSSNDSRGQLRGSLEPTGPEVNRKLVERFKKLLEENLPLASFGL